MQVTQNKILQIFLQMIAKSHMGIWEFEKTDRLIVQRGYAESC